jgi:outer membrane lipoprotein-sorting protein
MQISIRLVAKSTLLFGLATCLTLVVGSIGTGDKAKDYLFRSIQGDFNVNVTAFLLQRDSGARSSKKVKVQRAKDGKIRNTILEPLREQGVISVDDGDRQFQYQPTNRVLVIQPSASKMDDRKTRIGLIQKNYELEASPGPKIAGRSTLRVEATSNFEEMGGVKFYFDEKTGYPLKRESFDDDDETRLIYEIYDISFPESFEKDVFKIKPTGGFETITFSSPMSVSSVSKAAKTLGFEPNLNPKLPFGFQIQSRTITDNGDWKALSVKLTDGLQRATVYQWLPRENDDISASELNTIISFQRTKLMVVSDLPTAVRVRILNAFTRAGSSGGSSGGNSGTISRHSDGR